MEIRQLKYFRVLAKQQHMGVAADALNITQPALSKSISSLENELEVKLFNRKGNRLYLNSNGQEFARSVDRILNELEMSRLSLHQNRFEFRGNVRITCRVFTDSIIDGIAAYMNLNPLVQVSLYQSPQGEANLNSNIDFLLGSYRSEELKHEWIVHPLFDEEAYILISSHYREYPAEVNELAPATLKDDLFITDFIFSELFTYTDIVQRVCRSAGFFPRIRFFTDDFLSKVKILEDGLAITILPHSCLRIIMKLAPSVRAFRIRGYSTDRTIGLMHRKDQLLSEEAQDFLEFIMDYYHQDAT